MPNLKHALACLCLLSAPAAAEVLRCEDPSRGRLLLRWTAVSTDRAHRLRGGYTVSGWSNSSIARVASPPDDALGSLTALDLPAGLYSLQLDPGSCVETRLTLPGRSADGAIVPDCLPTEESPPVLVIVEPGKQHDVSLRHVEARSSAQISSDASCGS
jgi:hypothetical protein